jgi:hypothetical protein
MSASGLSRHFAAMRYSVANGRMADVANLRIHALVPLEAHQRAHRHAELPDLRGAAGLRRIDDEAGGEHIAADPHPISAGGVVGCGRRSGGRFQWRHERTFGG